MMFLLPVLLALQDVHLDATVEPSDHGRVRITLTGTSTLPDSSVLRVQCTLLGHLPSEAGLTDSPMRGPAVLAIVRAGRVSTELHVPAGLRSALAVDWTPEFQSADLEATFATARRLWTRTLEAWTDGHLPSLVPALERAGPWSRRALEWISAYERAFESDAAWPALLAGSHELIRSAVDGPSAQGLRMLQHRGMLRGDRCRWVAEVPPDLAAERRRLAALPELAGRRFALDFLGEFRRCDGRIPPTSDAALEQVRSLPGVAPVYERLKSLSHGDLPALEAALRRAN